MDLEKPIELTHIEVKPIENNIYYEWLQLPEKIGGFFVKIDRVSMRRAVVHSVGPTCEMIEPGDKVLVSIHTGVHMFLCSKTDLVDGEHHRMCREDEVISLYADTPEEAKIIDERHKKYRETFLARQKKKEE